MWAGCAVSRTGRKQTTGVGCHLEECRRQGEHSSLGERLTKDTRCWRSAAAWGRSHCKPAREEARRWRGPYLFWSTREWGIHMTARGGNYDGYGLGRAGLFSRPKISARAQSKITLGSKARPEPGPEKSGQATHEQV